MKKLVRFFYPGFVIRNKKFAVGPTISTLTIVMLGLNFQTR